MKFDTPSAHHSAGRVCVALSRAGAHASGFHVGERRGRRHAARVPTSPRSRTAAKADERNHGPNPDARRTQPQPCILTSAARTDDHDAHHRPGACPPTATPPRLPHRSERTATVAEHGLAPAPTRRGRERPDRGGSPHPDRRRMATVVTPPSARTPPSLRHHVTHRASRTSRPADRHAGRVALLARDRAAYGSRMRRVNRSQLPYMKAWIASSEKPRRSRRSGMRCKSTMVSRSSGNSSLPTPPSRSLPIPT